jgi:hypothetical protein
MGRLAGFVRAVAVASASAALALPLVHCGGEDTVCKSSSAPAAATVDPAAEKLREQEARAAEQRRERAQRAAALASERPCDDLSVAECIAGCDAGTLADCVQLGEMYTRGERVPRDGYTGGRILRKACEDGSIRACYEHGMYFELVDPRIASDSLVRACSAEHDGSPVACATYLAMVDQRRIVPSNADLIAVARKACDIEKTEATGSMRGACGRLKEVGGEE